MRRWKDGYVGGRNSGSGCTGGGRISGVRLRHRPDREGRIKAHALPDQPPRPVRAVGAAGRAELADDLATRHAVADAHGDVLQVHVEGRQAVAVIDDDGAASEEHAGFGETDDAGVGRLDRRPSRRCDVDAQMRLARLAVEDRLTAKDTGDGSGYRPFKRRLEGDAVALLREGVIDLRGFALDARQCFGRRRHLGGRQVLDPAHAVMPLDDVEHAMETRTVAEHDVKTGTGRRIAAEADDEVAIGRDAHRLAVERDPPAWASKAANQCALRERAVEGQISGKCRRRDHAECRGDGEARHSSLPCSRLGGAIFAAFSTSRPTARAATLPSWNTSAKSAPGATVCAEVTTAPLASRTKT